MLDAGIDRMVATVVGLLSDGLITALGMEAVLQPPYSILHRMRMP